MSSLKEVKIRINSVKSTRQITSAMKMVASAKLHKAEGRINAMLPYQRQLHHILANFLGTETAIDSPFVRERPVQRVALVAFTSNTTLCGAYNSNVLRMLDERIRHYTAQGCDALLFFPVGKKVEEAVSKRGLVAQGSYQTLAEKPSYAEASQLANQLMKLFVDGKVDKVELLYHHFKSKGSQVLTLDIYLPLAIEEAGQPAESSSHYNHDYLVEPSVPQLLSALLPKVLSQKIYTVALDANASEHAARTLAMQTATDNADDLIHDLTKQYNKTRQQAITNELLDIVGGSMK